MFNQSILAYNILRSHIPNVPAETKLSKIKTLRYAASYIKYLMDILKNDDAEPAEFSPSDWSKYKIKIN